MRDHPTFSQSEGYEDMPEPPRLGDISSQARVAIWNLLYELLCEEHDQRRRDDIDWQEVGCPPQDIPSRVYPLEQILRDIHAEHHHRALDKLPRQDESEVLLHEFIDSAPPNKLIDLIEFIMSRPECPSEITDGMSAIFETHDLSYKIDLGPPVTFRGPNSAIGRRALDRNLDELRDAAGLDGCNTHLENAQQLLRAGDWAGSVRESINAVESIARQIDPAASTSLKDALKSLEKRGLLQHRALKDAFNKLYGYTSDEQGIRHALVFRDKANVTIDEAVFMLGACASFASYLRRKHKAAGSTL